MRRYPILLVVAVIATLLAAACEGRSTAADVKKGGKQNRTVPSVTDIVKPHHMEIISKYLSDKANWAYFNEITLIDADKVIADKHMYFAFQKLFSTQLNKQFLEAGDRMPFILISPSGTQAVVVYEKTRMQYLIAVPVAASQGGWVVGSPQEISLR